MPVLSASTSLVAISEAVPRSYHAIGAMYDGRV